MRVFWYQGGLQIQPEGKDEVAVVLSVEKAIRALVGARIANEEPLNEGAAQAALGSASNER